MLYSAGVSLICKFHVLGAVIYTTAPTHVKGVPGPEWIGSLSTSWALIVWDSIGKEGRGGGLRPTDAHRPRKNKGSIPRQSGRVEDSVWCLQSSRENSLWLWGTALVFYANIYGIRQTLF